MRSAGNLFMDVPHYLSLAEVIDIAQDRQAWKEMIKDRIPEPNNPIYNYNKTPSNSTPSAPDTTPPPTLSAVTPTFTPKTTNRAVNNTHASIFRKTLEFPYTAYVKSCPHQTR